MFVVSAAAGLGFLLERLTVREGRLMLPDGVSYRLLVLLERDATGSGPV